MKETMLALATLGFVICSGCTSPGAVTTWGADSSYNRATGFEFNFTAVGFDGTPDIVVFCRVQVANQRVPSFTYKLQSKSPSSYNLTINGTDVVPPKGQMLFLCE